MEELSSVELFGDDFGGERMWGLRELPLPDAASLFPQTVGWLLISIFLVALLSIYAWQRYRHWRNQEFRRNAIRSLEWMHDDASRLRDLPYLLRRVAVIAFAREEVIALHGADWISWLNAKVGKQLFDDFDAEILNELAYSQHSEIDPERITQLLDASLHWVRLYHV